MLWAGTSPALKLALVRQRRTDRPLRLRAAAGPRAALNDHKFIVASMASWRLGRMFPELAGSSPGWGCQICSQEPARAGDQARGTAIQESGTGHVQDEPPRPGQQGLPQALGQQWPGGQVQLAGDYDRR